MSKKGGGSIPQPQSVDTTAKTQTAYNQQAIKDSAALNAIDIIGPTGSTVYKRRPDGTPYAQVTTLTPDAKAAFDTQQKITSNLSSRALNAINSAPTTPFTLNGVPYDPRNVDTSKLRTLDATSYGRPGGDGTAVGGGNIWNMSDGNTALPYDPRSYGDVSTIDQAAADRVYDEFQRTSGADFDLQLQRLTNDLNNRGIPVGSPAWNKAYAALQQSQDSSRRGAANQAYLTGHQVAGDTITREQGLRSTALAEALQFHDTANKDFADKLQLEQNLRGQIIGENNMVRNQSINDAAMYLTGAPAIQMPNAPNIPTYQFAPTDYSGIVQSNYANQMAAYNEKQKQSQGFWTGVGNAAATAATIWSSKAFKEDMGDADSFLRKVCDLEIRTWRYTDEFAKAKGQDTEKHIGPYAESWADTFGGPKDRIHLGDAIFVLYKAVQELAQIVCAQDAALKGGLESNG